MEMTMFMRSTYIVAVTILVIIIAAGTGGYLVLREPSRPASIQHQREVLLGKFTAVTPPRPAPDIAFTTIDGKARKLTDLRGHWLLVNLWATWCGPCIEEMKSLNQMQTTMGAKLDVIAISEDRKGAAVVKPFVIALSIPALPIGLDPAGAAAGALKVQGLPTSFLIDPKGRIVAELEGAADWDAAQTIAALNALMTEKQG
jgi:thiol-disulfide isomerase/thioredoxin